MKRVMIISGTILTITLVAFGAARAQQSFTRPHPLTEVQQALNLSTTQVDAVRAILNLRMQSMQSAQEDIRAKRQALAEIQQQPNPNATELGNAVQAVEQARQALTQIHEKFILDFEALLTAEQKAVVADTRAAAGRIQALGRLGILEAGPGPGRRGMHLDGPPEGGPGAIGGPGQFGPGPRGRRGPNIQ